MRHPAVASALAGLSARRRLCVLSRSLTLNKLLASLSARWRDVSAVSGVASAKLVASVLALPTAVAKLIEFIDLLEERKLPKRSGEFLRWRSKVKRVLSSVSHASRKNGAFIPQLRVYKER